MRRFAPVVALLVFGLSAAPALAQSDDDDDLSPEAVEALLRGPAPKAANVSQAVNGWRLERENGVCRMFNFNDRLTIQADPSDPLRTQLQFGMIDRDVPEAHGTQVPMILALRGPDDAKFEGQSVVVVASKDAKSYGYLLSVPLDRLVSQLPDGFDLVLMDKNEQPILKSSTLGARQHLADMAACARHR